MTTFQLPYFGEININSVEEYYCINAEIGEREIKIDINFENKKTDEITMKIVKDYLLKIPEIDSWNIKKYTKDFLETGETQNYIEFYLEELMEEELKELIDTNQDIENQKKQLLEKLELKRIGIYPDEKFGASYFGVFDYSIKIDEEFCNQLLVLKTNEKGELDHITWES